MGASHLRTARERRRAASRPEGHQISGARRCLASSLRGVRCGTGNAPQAERAREPARREDRSPSRSDDGTFDIRWLYTYPPWYQDPRCRVARGVGGALRSAVIELQSAPVIRTDISATQRLAEQRSDTADIERRSEERNDSDYSEDEPPTPARNPITISSTPATSLTSLTRGSDPKASEVREPSFPQGSPYP